MGELYNPFPKLPKNIRQIGDTDQVVRLYVEDYVNTYLKRLYPAGNQTLRVGLLLGSTENYDGTPYIFIDGAIEMEDVEVSGEKIEFSENAWKKAYRGIEESFPKRTVQGWFICGAPSSPEALEMILHFAAAAHHISSCRIIDSVAGTSGDIHGL